MRKARRGRRRKVFTSTFLRARLGGRFRAQSQVELLPPYFGALHGMSRWREEIEPNLGSACAAYHQVLRSKFYASVLATGGCLENLPLKSDTDPRPG